MRTLQLVALCALALAFAPAVQAGSNDGYLVDKDGKIIKSANGLCVRSTRWNEASADRACLDTWRGMKTATRK